MIKVEVIEEFTLGRFNELKNIVRTGKEETGRLFIGDTLECEKDMADYLLGSNALGRAFVKVIEVIPKENKEPVKETKPKATKKTTAKKTTTEKGTKKTTSKKVK